VSLLKKVAPSQRKAVRMGVEKISESYVNDRGTLELTDFLEEQTGVSAQIFLAFSEDRRFNNVVRIDPWKVYQDIFE